MRTHAIKDFRNQSKEDLLASLPCEITWNCEPIFICHNSKDMIYIGDMHPRVRQMFKAMENKVRLGMPKDEQNR